VFNINLNRGKAMKKLLVALLVMAALNVADVSAWCRKGCGAAAPIQRQCGNVPSCYVEEIVQVPVTAECETVCFCPPGTITANNGASKVVTSKRANR
jgi:hypothetical protein